MMKASQKAIDLIKYFESFSAEPYLCPANYLTIGYGHRILPNENFEKITEEEAEIILKKDMIFAEKAINEFVEVELSQNQFDALVSFVFNVGVEAFKNSTLLRSLNGKKSD